MNCQEFENSFEALARGALADARGRAEALAHEKDCDACAARLADERALSTGLRALASGMKDASAPARVEASLLAAFRAHSAAAVDPATNTEAAANVVPFAGRAEVRRWSWARTAAVASLAAAASVALFVLVQTRTGVNPPAASPEVAGRAGRPTMIEPPPAGTGVQPAAEAASSQYALTAPGAAPAHDALTVRDAGGADPRLEAAAVDDRASRASYSPRVRAVNAAYGNGGGRGGRHAAGRAGAASAQELTTEFIPLLQEAQYAQAGDAHLVRVELPRTALASFGLLVNAESPNARVKADVLLGEDGIARAIRFVR